MESINKICLSLVLVTLAVSSEEVGKSKELVRNSFVCPANYVRLGHRCYYFGQEDLTWNEAYFKCRELHGNIAVIRTPYQDKLLRQALHRASITSEWWLGGLYDWENMSWKWGASGRNVTYDRFAFPQPENKKELQWNCIVMDPNLQYKWNWKACYTKKHFICHSKLRDSIPKAKKRPKNKLDDQLNEILLPDELDKVATDLKEYKPNDQPSNDLNAFAHRAKEVKKRRGKKNKLRKLHKAANGTALVDYVSKKERAKKYRPRRYKSDRVGKVDLSMEKLKWKTYYNGPTLSPLHPRGIVEEFVYRAK